MDIHHFLNLNFYRLINKPGAKSLKEYFRNNAALFYRQTRCTIYKLITIYETV